MSGHERYEEKVTRLTRAQWDEDTIEHVKGCEECRESAAVAQFMSRVAENTSRAPLPDPQILWLKAQLLGNAIRQQEEVVRKTSHLQWAIWASVGLLWAGIVSWKWDTITALMVDFSLQGFLLSSVAGESAISIPFVIVLTALMGITAMMAVHAIFAEE
jgi:hypothetical protein